MTNQIAGDEHSWRIENDVLITDSGIAFLAGGNQQPLKYATGALTPTPASLETFARNVEGRSDDARRRGIDYAHVIFPDKQSVMDDHFPFQPVVRLGDVYLSQLPESSTRQIVYPVQPLKRRAGSYLPYDTHLSHSGSLVVLREMLASVGVDEPDALSRIQTRITQPRQSTGDLGSKLSPPLMHETLQLVPDWGARSFSSGGSGNDGLIDILFNFDAPVDATVVMFGDSFFRLMLTHMSAVFSRVVCLRTRFYHREMVELIEPRFVFTGNAERYLSRVFSDANAMPFSLYREMSGEIEAFNPDFLDAWQSVTAPRSAHARTYLAALRSTVSSR